MHIKNLIIIAFNKDLKCFQKLKKMVSEIKDAELEEVTANSLNNNFFGEVHHLSVFKEEEY